MNNNAELDIFVKNVLRLKREYGYTQKEMAQIMKVSTPTLKKIEDGKFPPGLGLNTIERVCKHFKIYPKDLFTE